MAPMIYKAMAAILKDVDAIEKTRQSGGNFSFKFRGIDDAMNTLHDVFAKHEVFITHELVDHQMIERSRGPDKLSFHHIVKVRFYFHHSDGSNVVATGIGEAADTGDKGAGKAMSYALKVCLLQTFLIPTEEIKDPDFEQHEFNRPAPKPTTPPKPAVPASAAKAAQQFKQAIAFESRVDKAQAERELIQSCEKQLQSVGTEPYEYPKHKDLVVAAAKELGISSPRLSAHRDALNEFLYTSAYSNHASVKSAMETFFSQLPGGAK